MPTPASYIAALGQSCYGRLVRSSDLTLAVSWFVLGVGLSACTKSSDPDVVRQTIGPDGGLVTSADAILTIAIQPGALDQSVEISVQRSEDPPDVYGPAFLVRPNLELAVPSTVTYRYPLPEDTSEVAVGYVDADEFADGDARWRPLPVVRLEPAQKLVTATDTELSIFYALLDERVVVPDPTTSSSTTTGPGDPTVDPSTTTTTTVDPSTTTDPTTEATVDPSTTSGSTTGPGEQSSSGETTDTETTGTPDACDMLPAGPLPFDEFMFDGTPLDGNSEDMSFSTEGNIIVRNGPDLVRISPAGVVTVLNTSVPLNDTLGLRWTVDDTIVINSLAPGEILEIDPVTGNVAQLEGGLGFPNALFPALDGNIFFSDFTGQLIAWMDPAGATVTTLAAGGDDAPQANGTIYDPDRNYVYYVSYGPGLIWRVDVTDLNNPGTPENIGNIPVASVGLDGLALDACGNLYVVDQQQGGPGALYRIILDDLGDIVGAPEAIVPAFPAGVANAVFAQGPGWEAYENTIFVVGLPGRIFTVDVGVPGAPTPVGG